MIEGNVTNTSYYMLLHVIDRLKSLKHANIETILIIYLLQYIITHTHIDHILFIIL